ncbi:E3 ubiquitin-protein ligase listerin isoform X2 [Rhodamnia argentea]|nr:E3 ubiquitin-protein ligase listerin isoform X2 [Rhodamnia argentea]
MWDVVLIFSKRFPDCWTFLNAQKFVLNRLWHFLRSGCFGSQQISYPALLVFLETVPHNVVRGEQFFLDLFHNLWAGRKPSVSSIEDRAAFFRAFKECFLWALQNASRYFVEVSSVHCCQRTLVENILVKLLWEDFLLVFSPKVQSGILTGISTDSSEGQSPNIQKKIEEKPPLRYPVSYPQDLGKCIVEILSGIFQIEHDLLSAFSLAFRESFRGICQHSENEGRLESVERLIQFLLLMEQHAVRKSEYWPLDYMVGPTLAESFSSIESLDSPDGIRFLSAAISIFGPNRMVKVLLVAGTGSSSLRPFEEQNRSLELEHFMYIFEKRFVPWCLTGNGSCSAARLDLLLALLDDECLSEQWSFVLSHTIKLRSEGPEHAAMLCTLLQKARDKITNRQLAESELHINSYVERWHHELLDSLAVAVASSRPPNRIQEADFLRSALGGSSKDDQIFFLSRDSLVLVFKALLEKLVYVILGSPFKWVRDAGSTLASGIGDLMVDGESHSDKIDMAKSVLAVLLGSFYCLLTLNEDELVSSILAAICVLHWESRMGESLYDVPDDKWLNLKARFEVGKSLHAFLRKINGHSWQDLGIHCREKSSTVLVQSIRYAILEEHDVDASKVTTLCCEWILEVIEFFCLGQYEEQILLEQLLKKSDQWPVWISVDFDSRYGENDLTGSNISGGYKFASLVDKLITKRGVDRVFCCNNSNVSPLSEETVEEVTHRAWLAAEMLCTWEWPGGSSITTFLPLLSACAKSEVYPPKEGLLDSIFDILLDAALVRGGSRAQSFPNFYGTTADEVKNIKEPFVRALLSLVVTLFNDDVWKYDKARTLFQVLINKLMIGDTVSINCLQILPLIMRILIQPLCRSHKNFTDLESLALENDEVQETIMGWLQRILSFPPLLTWQWDNDMEEWFQLVVSCYPIGATDRSNAPKPERKISLREKTLLLDFFRKQRVSIDLSNASNHLQMLLSKLIVFSVGYCANDFNEEDWDFVLSMTRFWIQSAVVMMEDVVENVNDVITDDSCSDKSDFSIIEKLEQIVLIKDHNRLDTAKSALLAYSSFSGVQLAKVVDDQDPSRTEKWESTKDRITGGILRIFLCAGLAEAIASLHSHEAASVVALSLLDNLYFWESVARGVNESSPLARERAVRSVDCWGLSKGSISSLYAILFSPKPAPPLQFAAYRMLSSEPVSHMAIREETMITLDGEQDSSKIDLLSEQNVHLKEEISSMIEKSRKMFEMDLLAEERVHILLAWSLLLSHIWSLPSSPARERLVQYIHNSVDPVIIDCLFQHILDVAVPSNQKKKDTEFPAGVYEAAKEAITRGCLLSSVESLWPIEPLTMASLAGAIFGLMLRLLPAYVREWFGYLRDRSTIEYFTKTWCSPPLISNELSQIKKASFVDENFSIRVSKAANEVVATYTKEETGFDLVIRLPASYPLQQVDVDCPRSKGISEDKQRKWLLSMMSFVRNQNGALAEAIRIWKRNIDKKFEGVEECPICYSVIHTENHSLPSKACKVCKHKFHSKCIFKWFNTSQKSNCPLCQSTFL